MLEMLELLANEEITMLSQSNDIVKQTYRLIQQHISTEKIAQQYIANLMGVSAKTLQRKLKASGTTFMEIFDQVRLVYSEELLKSQALTLNEISAKLAFNEPRSFFRWFQKMHSMTPGQYRKGFKLSN